MTEAERDEIVARILASRPLSKPLVHRYSEGAGARAVLEWWKDDRKITIDVDEDGIALLRVWGGPVWGSPGSRVGMEGYEVPRDLVGIETHWAWLDGALA